MTTVQQLLAQQEAQFWAQKAETARHNAAWHAASYQRHGPPRHVGDNLGRGANSHITRANVTGREIPTPLPQHQPGQTVSANDPGLRQARAQHDAQQQRAQREQNARLEAEVKNAILQMKAQIASIGAAVNRAVAKAQPQAPPQQRPANYQLATSPYTGQPSHNRAMVNQSVGLSPVEPVTQPEQLPISPMTGKPSALRAMINRSVGLEG